jgi:hypothetical protein
VARPGVAAGVEQPYRPGCRESSSVSARRHSGQVLARLASRTNCGTSARCAKARACSRAYELLDGTRIWIITEADRSATTILLPEEYYPPSPSRGSAWG